MDKALRFALLLLVPAALSAQIPVASFIGPAIPAVTPSYVAECAGTNQTGSNITSLSCSSSLNVQAGDALIATYRYEQGCVGYGSSVSVQTGIGDYFQGLIDQTDTSNAYCQGVAIMCGAVASASSTPTLYISFGQAYVSLQVLQFRKIQNSTSPSACADATAYATGSSTTLTSPSFSTTQANEAAFSTVSVNNTGQTFTAGGSYTKKVDDGMAASGEQIFSGIKTGATSSWSWGSSSAATVEVATLRPGNPITGHGVPSGHGVIVWGAVTATSASNCGGADCIMKVTDSAGNSYTTLQTNNSVSGTVTNFLAFGYVSTGIPGDGSGWVRCSFFQSDGTTPVVNTTWCRIWDASNLKSTSTVDGSAQNTFTGTSISGGSVTVGGSNTDLVVGVYDVSLVAPTVSAGTGYTLIIPRCALSNCAADGAGGQQASVYAEETSGSYTPTISLTSSSTTYGFALALVENSSGGSVSSINGDYFITANSPVITVQVPAWY